MRMRNLSAPVFWVLTHRTSSVWYGIQQRRYVHTGSACSFPEPDFYLWLRKVSANEGRRYICNVFPHWPRPCSAIDRNWPCSSTLLSYCNTDCFLQNVHNRHPITRQGVWGIGYRYFTQLEVASMICFPLVQILLYPPLQRSWKGGILVSPCPSVMSALYLQQYSLDPFHICISYQATSEGVSRVMFVPKFKNLKFDFDFVFFLLGIQFDSKLWLCLLLTWDPIWFNSKGNHEAAGGILRTQAF